MPNLKIIKGTKIKLLLISKTILNIKIILVIYIFNIYN